MKAVYFLVIVLLLASCQKDDECTKSVSSSVWTSLNQVQLQSDIAAIDAYLFAHSITAMEHESGLRYVITQNGVGSPPSCLEKTVSVTYSGKLLTTGVEFDFSTTPISFPLNKLIAGWKIGIPLMNKGAKATLYIPSGLAYGNQAIGDIPANSNLIFEVTLVDY